MSPLHLDQAQQDRRRRGDDLAVRNEHVVAELLCDAVENLSNADRVGPAARQKLKGLLNYYRKMAHPFTACVRDNTKRFGPDRAKKVCAVLTDIEKGTTKWRNGGSKKVGASLAQAGTDLSDITASPAIDDELFSLLDRIAATDYKSILGLEVQ